MRRARRFLVLFAIVLVGMGVVFSALKGRRRGAERSTAGGAISRDAAEDPNAVIEGTRRYPVRSWSFPLDRYEMTIEDTGMTTALDAVLEKTNGELAVNAGFFGPDGKPVGLSMSKGVITSRLSKAASGGVLVSDGTTAKLFATEDFDLRDAAADARYEVALQCRPRLVVDSVVNIKRDDGRRAERTALCTRDGGKVVDVFVIRGSDDGESPGPSLFAFAQHLAARGCESALNLDGGPSTGVAWHEDGGVEQLAPRAPIRQAVVFEERR